MSPRPEDAIQAMAVSRGNHLIMEFVYQASSEGEIELPLVLSLSPKALLALRQDLNKVIRLGYVEVDSEAISLLETLLDHLAE